MSDERVRSRKRRQFGFDGPRRRLRSQDSGASVDDILDSLTRRTQISGKFDTVENVPVKDEPRNRFTPNISARSLCREGTHRSIGKFAFALMLISGLTILGLYGALKAVTEPSSILRITENPTFTSVFTDPVRLALVALLCVIPAAIFLRRGRRTRLSCS